jgi:fructose-1,6-bisphosphatase I
LYECAPLSLIAEQAGGMVCYVNICWSDLEQGSNGEQNILDIEPTGIHQREALFIGNKYDVLVAMDFLSGKRKN